jgi:hypothetical protein
VKKFFALALLASAGGIGLALFACASAPPPQHTLPPDTSEVTVLARPSDNYDAAAIDNTTAPTGDQSQDVGTDPSLAGDGGTAAVSDVTPAVLKTSGPGMYTVTAYVVRVARCPPCPPTAQCKPCVPNAVYVSSTVAVGGKDPTDTIDLQVPDPGPYQTGTRYQFIVTVAPGVGDGAPTRHLVSGTAQ